MVQSAKQIFWKEDQFQLPNGWHLIDYIAGNSSRTAYINTKIFPTNNTKIEVITTLDPAAANGWLFATEDYYHNTQNAANGPCYSVGWNGRLTYGGGYTEYEKRLCDFKLGKPVHLTINNGIMYVNDSICFDRSTSTLSNCSWIALLANNRTSSGVIEKANGDYKVHRFSAYEDNQLVLDLVPVADGSGIGAMYDLVSKELFMNSGTGNFEIGQEIK